MGLNSGRSLTYQSHQLVDTDYHIAAAVGMGQSTVLLATGIIYAVPTIINRSCTLDGLAIEVTTIAAVSGGDAAIRLGIYADNGAVSPGNLILDAGQTGSVLTTGVKPITISQPLSRGLYWFVLFHTTALVTTFATVRCLTVAATAPTLGFAAASFNTTYTQFRVTGIAYGAFAASWPTTYGAPTKSGANCPMIAFSLSS